MKIVLIYNDITITGSDFNNVELLEFVDGIIDNGNKLERIKMLDDSGELYILSKEVLKRTVIKLIPDSDSKEEEKILSLYAEK